MFLCGFAKLYCLEAKQLLLHWDKLHGIDDDVFAPGAIGANGDGTLTTFLEFKNSDRTE